MQGSSFACNVDGTSEWIWLGIPCAFWYKKCMELMSASERRFLQAVAGLAYSNPFLPERIEFERRALGREFVDVEPVWSASVADPTAVSPNVGRILEKLEAVLGSVRDRLHAGAEAGQADVDLYEECVHDLLYERYYPQLLGAKGHFGFYRQFIADWRRHFDLAERKFETGEKPAFVFACFWQIQRAFGHIFDNIIGSSMPAARLRAAVWQSIFSHDMRRYRRVLWRRMSDFPTLITGPSGTGKELVARAIAGSRFVPFDPVKQQFEEMRGEAFHAINLAAFSPALIESELFGHRRGSFTGAIGDRQGWLETCPALGSVFLDELGEMDPSIQVKLLRVIETRRFSVVGDTTLREFRGKLIAATNRDLAAEIRAGRFREDLYYRLCADQVETPSLAEQIDDSPEVFDELLLYMVRRAVGDEAEASVAEVRSWIRAELPAGYRWPGNYRELEQCVRNVLVHRSYRPLAPRTEGPVPAALLDGRMTADEALSFYVSLVYEKCGSYEEAARRLDLDRRTVKAKVEAWRVKK